MTKVRPSTVSCRSTGSTRRESLSNGTDIDEIAIGIVNNMPLASLHSTEKQFNDLLHDAAQDQPVHLRMFSPSHSSAAMPGKATDELWTSKLDGLIVTGTEPRSSRLMDEPCWPLLAKLADWAEDNTISTVWSCLSAHAAVYRMDGIERRAFDTKLFGVFDCETLGQHPVLDECPLLWTVPHSRYNDLPEDALVSHGYQLLTRSPVAGADSFMKQAKSLHLFQQGHLEYDVSALGREYRRDVKRFLLGETDRYPDVPLGYFADESIRALGEFRKKALRNRKSDLYAAFPQTTILRSPSAPWRSAATQLYRNWICYLKNQRIARNNAARSCGAQNDNGFTRIELGAGQEHFN
jgi:homoserine O-succinyltransferase